MIWDEKSSLLLMMLDVSKKLDVFASEFRGIDYSKTNDIITIVKSSDFLFIIKVLDECFQ
jgi:hypothetical protein